MQCCTCCLLSLAALAPAPHKPRLSGLQRKGWRPDLFQSATGVFPLETSRLEARRQTGSLKGVRLIGSEAHLVLVLCSRTDCCCLRSLDREICQDHPFRYRLTHLSNQWDWSLCGRVQVYRQMWGKEPKVAVHPGPATWATIYCLELIFCTVQIAPPERVFFSVKCVTEHLNLHATSESGHGAHVMGRLIWVNTLLLSTGTFKPSSPLEVCWAV